MAGLPSGLAVDATGLLQDGPERQVGRVAWYGRCLSYHHLGTGPAREVDFLKGADPLVDQEIRTKVMTWKYRPYAIDGRPVPLPASSAGLASSGASSTPQAP